METKKCTKCGRELPLSEFGKCARNKDGLQYTCKECTNSITRNYYANRPKVANTLRLKGVIGGGEERTPNQIMEEIKERANILRGLGMEVNIEINYTKSITL